jgi:hypothetical protein
MSKTIAMKAGCLYAFVVALLLAAQAEAQQFTTFPQRAELSSPDGRFPIRSVDHAAGPSDFSGVFRSLILEEVPSGVAGTLQLRWPGGARLVGESSHYLSPIT